MRRLAVLAIVSVAMVAKVVPAVTALYQRRSASGRVLMQVTVVAPVPVVRAVTLLPVAPTDPVVRAVTLVTVGWAARPLRVGSPVRPALMVVMAVTRVRQPSVVWPVPAVPVATSQYRLTRESTRAVP
jgi:hypothetical protein